VKEPARMLRASGKGDFQLEDFLPFRLSVASENTSRIMTRHYLDQAGLGMAEWRLLAAVGLHGVLSPTAAGEHTAMDKVKVSRAAASLVAGGYVKQSQDPSDGRGRLLRLTRKGNTVYSGLPDMAQQLERLILEGLTATDRANLQKILLKLVDHTKTLLNGRDSDDA
jgi:DNA-binding MarR family transcriptional regulator